MEKQTTVVTDLASEEFSMAVVVNARPLGPVAILDDRVKLTSHGILFQGAALSYQEWMSLGGSLVGAARSAMWNVGDFLAYGQERYLESVWGKRMPAGVYASISKLTGIPENSLTAAKYVCSKIPLCKRSDKLTFSHAREIVSRAPEPQLESWIHRNDFNNWSVRELRAELMANKRTKTVEKKDEARASILSIAEQFNRSFCSEADRSEWTPAMWSELARVLMPTFARFEAQGFITLGGG